MFEAIPNCMWRPDKNRINKMMFIGRDLSREDFTYSFKSCLVANTSPQASGLRACCCFVKNSSLCVECQAQFL